jgi:hypothetical protein
MMRKLVDETRLESFQGNRAVGNPDAFAIKIHLTGGGVAGLFLGSGSGKQRPVKQRQLRLPGGIWNGGGEWAGIFVINVLRSKPQTEQKVEARAASSERGPSSCRGDAWARAASAPYKS